MPPAVLNAVEIIGNAPKTAILRQLSIAPTTSLRLAELIGAAHSSVHRHLVQMEEHGLVTADIAAGERRRPGVTVTWSANTEQISRYGQRWTAYARGDS